jgi:hypothetical protein
MHLTMTRITALLLSALLPLGGLAKADGLHCLGRAPAFMMILDGDEARFDYLGDGVFELEPAFTLPQGGVTRLTLSTFGGPLPVYVERRACLAFGATLDFTVEIGVQTSQGMQPMVGCCREAP